MAARPDRCRQLRGVDESLTGLNLPTRPGFFSSIKAAILQVIRRVG
jgi:hypothetical protein